MLRAVEALVKTGVLGAEGGLFASPQLFDVFIRYSARRCRKGFVFFIILFCREGRGDYFLYCVPKWASLQDRLGCSAAAAAATRFFSVSLLNCSTLEAFCRMARA